MNEKAAEQLAESGTGREVGADVGPAAPPRSSRSEDRITSVSTHRLPRGTMVRAFTRRDFLVTSSYRVPFVLDAFSGVILLATYYFISRTFEGVPTESLQGAPSYFAFAAVGAAIGAVVETSCAGIANRIRQEQLAG